MTILVKKGGGGTNPEDRLRDTALWHAGGVGIKAVKIPYTH